MRRVAIAVVAGAIALGGCGGGTAHQRRGAADRVAALVLDWNPPPLAPRAELRALRAYHVPPLLDPRNVYAADRRGKLSPVVRRFRKLVYVPNSGSNTVDEIDPSSYRIVRQFNVGAVPQHIVPSYDLRTLWVTNDIGNSLTSINPCQRAAGRDGPGRRPLQPVLLAQRPLRAGDGGVATADRLPRRPHDEDALRAARAELRRREPRRLHRERTLHAGQLRVRRADGRGRRSRAAGRADPDSCRGERRPQDVKLSPDGRVFYVADLTYGGVWEIDARSFRRRGFLRTGAGCARSVSEPQRDSAVCLQPRGGHDLGVSFARRRVIATWRIPGGSPDMGGVSASGHVLWLSGRYDASVYAINTRTGRLIRRIAVGFQPHGLCVYPQPGRYSLGHTGVMR